MEMISNDPEDIVISGIAGRFPASDNVKHLQENLFNKIDLGSDDERRWMHRYPDVPRRTGKVNNIDKFDAEYFQIPAIEAHQMDPVSRLLLEHTYEAIIDAGVNPNDIRGTKTAVFIGACYSETEEDLFYEKAEVIGFGLLGCSRALLANRISYWLGVTGPSNATDSACSSSLTALDRAYRSIWLGECDAAIVGGVNLCLHPFLSLQFARLGILSRDGICKVFDDNANGYMRSETIAVVYLQKLKNAKRVYATIVYTKANSDGYKEQGITFPSTEIQIKLLEEIYEECGISPSSLNYLEAHGTGTYIGDPEELNAIDKVICKNRRTPLLIGSVKSNLGHSEAASGLCQIAKVIIAMETGIIPPNINFKKIRSGIKSLENGNIRVVTDPTPWKPGLVGINSFGFGGSNVHVVLQPNLKEKINKGIPNDDLPRLIVISGRTKQAVESFLDEIKNRPIDVEYCRLLHDIFATDISNHSYRGYVICESKTSLKPIKEIQQYPGVKSPIYFVFSGIGSQWLGMGEALLQFSAFSKSIEKCDKILRPYGVHVIEILTSKQETIFNNILNSLVGIIVMQIGLIDLLRSINIKPDHVIGLSIGELCCGYSTDIFTMEQVLLSAYYIGLTLNESKIIHGAMMNVPISYEKVKNICSPDLEISCISPNICYISGPYETIKSFATKLQVNDIPIMLINCNNVPFHSHYLVPAKDMILARLNKILPQTVINSDTWTSSVFDKKLLYAEYFTNNLLNPMFHENAIQSIPDNAITIEIAPDKTLQKEFTGTNIALMQRNHKDNVKLFLQALGKIYNAGLLPQLANLYPIVEFPVSRGTPMISPLIKWNHIENWYTLKMKLHKSIDSAERIVDISLKDEDYEYMSGHVIDGRNLLPATGYIFLIWETVAMLRNELFSNISVVFEDVKFLRATHLSKQGTVELTIMLQRATGNFEIIEANNPVVSGRVRIPNNIVEERVPCSFLRADNQKEEIMTTKDIYKEFKLRGYNYSGVFRGLKSASVTGRQGYITWAHNWVSFMDCMLQLKILSTDTKNLYVPTNIKKLIIDTSLHGQFICNKENEDEGFLAHIYNDCDVIMCGGIEIQGLKASYISRRKTMAIPILEQYKFVAHRDGAEISFKDSVILSTHLALEQHQMIKPNVIELIEDCDNITEEELASPLLEEVLSNLPLIQPNINLITRTNRFKGITLSPKIIVSQTKILSMVDEAILITGLNLLNADKIETLKETLLALKDNGFLLIRGQPLTKNDLKNVTNTYGLLVVLEKRTRKDHILLLKKKRNTTRKTEIIHLNNYEFSWVEELKKILSAEIESGNDSRIILIGEKDPECGLLGFVNCLRKEPGGDLIRGVFIQDEIAPKFSLHESIYAQQLELDLIINVLRPGRVWGSYRHLPLPSLATRPVHHAFVNQQVRGDLNSFRWLQGEITTDVQHEDLVRIIYASLNFKDVMQASGKINIETLASPRRLEECFIGLEYVGFDSTGCRVMGVCENRCLANLRIVDRYLRWYIPDTWSLEDAATVPCAYSTCYYALYIRGKIKKNDKILIHSGTGAVGQAAINLALHEGCEIFVTVGASEKRKFIRDIFPSIPEDHIGNSRDTSFEQMILKLTKGRGVDIVLNSLAEEKLEASLRCLAASGRFLEIGKFDFMADNSLDMSIFSKGIEFHSIMVDNVFSTTKEMKESVHIIVNNGLKNGAIKPISRRVFQKSEVKNAFRYMTSGKHMGKVIIKMEEDGESAIAPVLAFPRYYCCENKTYVILGGLGGFGLELTDWLVIRGARNLVIISRSGVKNGYQNKKIELWKSYGVNVSIMSKFDVANINECEHILQSAEKLAPVDAIFNVAVVLNDKLCQNHTVESFVESFRAKAWATKNLDQISRKICLHLRHFVVFSSVSCGRGNAGQTNYGMANSVMERICERRSWDGLHGLAIQWGAVGDVGLVADMMDDNKEMIIGGTLQQKITCCIEKLEEFLLQDQPIVASMVVAEKVSNLGATDVVGTVANIMGIKDLSVMSHQTLLVELGMDSMMAVEVKQTLERDFNILLTPQDIRNLNFAKLIKISEGQNEKEFSKSNQDVNDLVGIKLLIRIIGDDHIPDVFMDIPTKESSAKCQVFLVPGIDGCANVFNPVIKKIEASATRIQYGVYNIGTSCNTINEIADCLFQHIMNSKKLGENFVMVGYSFGSLLAIELTHRLEKLNIKGRVVLIDGAPEQMKAMGNIFFDFTSDELEDNILLAVMDNLYPAISGKFLLDLKKCSNWDEKLDILINHVPVSETVNKISIDRKKALCTTLYKHILALDIYDAMQVPKIVSPIILLKPTIPSVLLPEENYGLHKITSGNIEIHYINGNHITMLDSNKVVAAINGSPIECVETLQSRQYYR